MATAKGELGNYHLIALTYPNLISDRKGSLETRL